MKKGVTETGPENAGVARQVRAWRRSLGLQQSTLEERAGLAHNALSRIECGSVSPRLETLEKIAAAMGLSVEELQFRDPPSDAKVAPGGGMEEISGLLDGLSTQQRTKALDAIRAILALVREGQ